MYVNEIVNLKLAEAIENPIKLIENIKSNSFMKMRWFSLKNINNSNFKIVDFTSFFDIKSYSMLILVIAEFEVRNDTLSQITKTTSFIPMMAYFFSDDIGKNHMPILINKCKDELGADVLLEIHGKDFYVRIIDASVLPEYCENIVNGIIEEYDIKSNMGGRFLYTKAGYYTMFSNLDVFELAKNESSNSLILARNRVVLKTFRNITSNCISECQTIRDLRILGGFENVPNVYGELSYINRSFDKLSLCICQEYIDNAISCFKIGFECLLEYMKTGEHDIYGFCNGSMIREIGILLADMHLAMSKCNFKRTCFDNIKHIVLEEFKEISYAALQAVRSFVKRTDDVSIIETCKTFETLYWNVIGDIEHMSDEFKCLYVSKCHGDMHLGQILVSNTKLYVSDFEGEPMKSIYANTKIDTPLKDISSMLRSFSYLGDIVLLSYDKKTEGHEELLTMWKNKARENFIESYMARWYELLGEKSFFLKSQVVLRLISFFEIEKCLKEILYEFVNRPEYIMIPSKHFINMCREFLT